MMEQIYKFTTRRRKFFLWLCVEEKNFREEFENNCIIAIEYINLLFLWHSSLFIGATDVISLQRYFSCCLLDHIICIWNK